MEAIAIQAIQNIYISSNHEMPEVVYLNNPLECLVALMVLNSVNGVKLGNDWQNVEEKLNKHWDYINYVFDGDFPYHKKPILLKGFKSYGLNTYQSDVALELYKDFKILFPDANHQKQSHFNSYCYKKEDDLASLLFIPFAKLCLVCDGPFCLERDEQNKLHSAADAAVKFIGGYSLYFWHGIRIPQEWIYSPSSITQNTIYQCQNIEQRRALSEILGNEKFVALLDLCVQETDYYNGQQVVLFRTRAKDKFVNDYLFYIKVVCNSTDREYFISIPRAAFLLNAIGALAWTFGLDANDYQLLIET